MESFVRTTSLFRNRTLLVFGVSVALAACSTGPQITRTQDVSESADTPYRNILVIALFPSFDNRKRLEKEIVQQLSMLGTDAVASTSLMNTKTPVTRQTFLAMVKQMESDAVLVTQPLGIESKTAMKDANPESTYNVRPTYYFNVWEVELTEYVEPQFLEIESSVALATQIYSVRSQEAVWAIESRFKMVQTEERAANYTYFVDEGIAIVKHLSRDGLIAQ